jgi:hypothetical protein
MAGFEVRRTLHRLTFEQYEGLEVVVRSTSVDGLLQLVGLVEKADAVDAKRPTAADMHLVGEIFDGFGALLHSWNCELDGEPLPADRAGLGQLDFAFAMEIIQRAVTTLTEPEAPLGTGSPTPPRDEIEASLPMTSLPS